MGIYENSGKKIITELVIIFFSSPLSSEINLFIWGYDNTCSVYYTWKLKNGISGSYGEDLNDLLPLPEKVLGAATKSEISKKINILLHEKKVIEDDLKQFFSGIKFTNENWKKNLIMIFGENVISDYEKFKLHKDLSNSLKLNLNSEEIKKI